MKVRIKEKLTQGFWWYRAHVGDIFEVERDEKEPRKYFSLWINGKHHHIRCCDARVIK
jgi:hypothetical protein